jgi:tRNA threonylcarbamoyladenosine biosynthesis protein TsaB
MRLLGLDTAYEACVVGLQVDDECLERREITPRGHAERLLPWVGELLAEAGLALTDLDAIAFGRGPGSFTSLRIGIGVVQGLAFGAGLPVVPVSSLAAIAAAGLDAERASGAELPGAVLVAMDARMDEVFSARYPLYRQGKGQGGPCSATETPERLETPARAAQRAEGGDLLLGNAFERCAELAGLGDRGRVRPDVLATAPALLRLACRSLRHHPGLPPEQAQPVYLRDQVAARPPGR